jgi:hypothetical protein
MVNMVISKTEISDYVGVGGNRKSGLQFTLASIWDGIEPLGSHTTTTHQADVENILTKIKIIGCMVFT